MHIEIIRCLQDNYSYLIIDENNRSACIVDPSESGPIIDFIDNNKINLKYILNTHHHHDHIGGNKELKEIYNCKIIGSYDDQNRIPGIDIKLKNSEEFNMGESVFKVIDTPGHTIGHICFYFKDQNFLFHSCISAMLNIGLITPDIVIEKVLDLFKKNN